ncbi:Phosphoenolpyruvate/pyruvate domain-containing protein [Coniochaeta sp. PMI_546]|nr:Phosphoenolpyruvate/pyruvate domain-containing protein [Coniochaeta sp. PMI_546]
MAGTQNALAQSFKALHKPHSPIILANVYDGASARVVASLPAAKAVATASYAVAAAVGVKDNDLTLEANLRATRNIASAMREFNKPLTVDFQDGYGEQLEDGTAELVRAGVVGINLEDYDNAANKPYSTSEAAERIRKVLEKARSLGVPDFVVNARCDTLVHGGDMSEVIARGQAYLAAGATTVFVWGGPGRGVSRAEVVRLVEAFDGRLNVLMKLADGLTARELADIGVARISLGPSLQLAAMEALKKEAQRALQIV